MAHCLNDNGRAGEDEDQSYELHDPERGVQVAGAARRRQDPEPDQHEIKPGGGGQRAVKIHLPWRRRLLRAHRTFPLARVLAGLA